MRTRNYNTDQGFFLLAIYLSVLLAAAGGWINNLVKLASVAPLEMSGMFVARIIGIFMFPLGAVLGYF